MSNKHLWTGADGAHRRIMYKGAGYSDDDIRHKPHIGIANTFSEASPATAHLRMLAEAVKQGVWAAGGVPFEFGVPGLCGNIGVGTEYSRYELAERDAVAAAIEVVSRINLFDGLVTLSSCDDILAGSLLGVGRVDIPTVMVTGGPMQPGCHQGKKVLAPDIEEYEFAGELPDDFDELENAACPGFGSCGVMGTANTMQIMVEALGLSLPGSATIPAVSADRTRAARASGHRVVALAEAETKPSDILTKRAFLNAITVDLAIGGSTNAILHLLALAREVGVDLTMDDFEAVSRKVSCICAVRPSGPYNIVDLHEAGGLPQIQKAILEVLDGSVTGVGAISTADIAASVTADPGQVVKSLADPVNPDPGLAVLKGNLSPQGAIIRPSGVPEGMKKFSGPARVFDDESAAIEAMRTGAINKGDVIVLRYMGPKGAPGMLYAQASCQALVGLGLHHHVGLITDGRFSGFNHGPIVGHVSPEAQAGGPIGLVHEGDIVSMDLEARSVHLAVDDDELARRKQEWQPREMDIPKGWLALYAANCRSAAEGAAMQPW